MLKIIRMSMLLMFLWLIWFRIFVTLTHVANEMIFDDQNESTLENGDVATSLCPRSNLSIPHSGADLCHNESFPYYNHYINYSILIGVDKLRSVLTNNATIDGLPMRYGFSESPLWETALEILDYNVLVPDWNAFSSSDVDDLSTNLAKQTLNGRVANPRDGPRVDTISGDDHFKLYQWTLNLPALLSSRSIILIRWRPWILWSDALQVMSSPGIPEKLLH